MKTTITGTPTKAGVQSDESPRKLENIAPNPDETVKENEDSPRKLENIDPNPDETVRENEGSPQKLENKLASENIGHVLFQSWSSEEASASLANLGNAILLLTSNE